MKPDLFNTYMYWHRCCWSLWRWRKESWIYVWCWHWCLVWWRLYVRRRLTAGNMTSHAHWWSTWKTKTNNTPSSSCSMLLVLSCFQLAPSKHMKIILATLEWERWVKGKWTTSQTRHNTKIRKMWQKQTEDLHKIIKSTKLTDHIKAAVSDKLFHRIGITSKRQVIVAKHVKKDINFSDIQLLLNDHNVIVYHQLPG